MIAGRGNGKDQPVAKQPKFVSLADKFRHSGQDETDILSYDVF